MAESGKVSNDIYTVLVFAALIILIAGIAFLLYRSFSLEYGNPFSADVQEISTLWQAVRPIMFT